MNLETFISEGRGEDRPILLDGAVGTELERRGFAIDTHPLWSVRALTEERGRRCLRRIHAAYAAAGAQILTANTFRVNPRLLARHGLLSWGAELAGAAVALVREAAPDSFVAGSISPLESCYTPSLVPGAETLRGAHRQTARWLKDAGVDLVILETMTTLREAEAALEAAAACGLPTVASFCCRPDGRLLGGEPLEEAIRCCGEGPLAIAVNCVSPDHLEIPLRILSRRARRGYGFYANFGELDSRGRWHPSASLTPEVYRAFVETWLARGVRWVGGCCGSTPRHIRALAALLRFTGRAGG